MSIRFSRIHAIATNKAAIFLVGGSPESQKDLNGWIAFDSFTEGLTDNAVVEVHIETFLYGDGEPFNATPE